MEKAKSGEEPRSKNRVRLAVGLVGVIAVALVAWLVLRGDDDSTSDSSSAEIVSVNSLRSTAALQERTVYWAGEQEGTELELSQPGGGRTYVRYLTDGADAGDPRPAFLTVGTYAQEDPVAALQRQGNEPGGVLAKAPGGATVYFSRDRPQSIYLAYPGVDAQIEVFDPDFKRALQLVNSGQIVPVG